MSLLKKHGGFFLSDVVGLGKTVIATMIAKKFFYENHYPEYRSRILIVTPPAMKDAWKETIEKFDFEKSNFGSQVDYITTGSLDKIKNAEKYDLILVDEAHKFRNSQPKMYQNLQKICKIKTRKESKKYVILISATPLNNQPEDLRNLIYLFQDSHASTLDISIDHFFTKCMKTYREIKKDLEEMIKGTSKSGSTQKERQEELQKLYEEIRIKVMMPLTVRRTRIDLMKNKQYQQDLKNQGICFPEVLPPEPLYYQMEDDLNCLFDETLKKILSLKYARWRVGQYLKTEGQTVETPFELLANLVKVLLTKRLDSSFHAFFQTLKRLKESNEQMLEMLEKDQIFVGFNTDEIESLDDDELLEKFDKLQEKNQHLKKYQAQDFKDSLKEDLDADAEIFKQLFQKWKVFIDKQNDPKFDDFVSFLKQHLNKSKRKVVVFSEATETILYLEKCLNKNGQFGVLAVHSKNRERLKEKIQANFDANFAKGSQQDQYQVLLATEAMAEGVNLHRADTVVNYDTPWNAVKLMQRLGRVNRIGTMNEKIYLYNFCPAPKVEETITLEAKARIKLQAFHSLLGEDSQIFSVDEKVKTFCFFEEGLTKEQDEQLKFLMDLRAFKQSNPDEFHRVQNLPAKIRHATYVDEQSKQLAGQSVVFLKNDQRFAFYQMASEAKNNEVSEVTFTQTASILHDQMEKEKKVGVKNCKLPKFHYSHIQNAQKYLKKEGGQKEHTNPALNQKEKKAQKFLKAFLNISHLSEGEKRRFENVLSQVEKGTVAQLVKDLNEYQKNMKKLNQEPRKDEFLKLFAPYENIYLQEQKGSYAGQSQIVISQSFLPPR